MKKTAIIIALCVVPIITLAQPETRALVPFLITGGGTGSRLENLINNLYALSITLAALLAVIKIIIGGVKWMLSDIVTTKEDAKKEIRTAVIGLLIVISAVLVLTVINPQTANINFGLEQIPFQSLNQPAGSITVEKAGDYMIPCEPVEASTGRRASVDCDKTIEQCTKNVGATAAEARDGKSIICTAPAGAIIGLGANQTETDPIPCGTIGRVPSCIDAINQCNAANGNPVRAADNLSIKCVTPPASSPGLPGTPEIPPEQPVIPVTPSPES